MTKNRSIPRITFFYDKFTDDFVVSAQQDYQLPQDFRFQRSGPGAAVVGRMIRAGFWLYGCYYSRLKLHVRFANQQVLRPYRHQGIYLYANHTQPKGDAFTPFQLLKTRPFAAIVSPANLGIPVVGKLLPAGGALPIPTDLHQFRQFEQAVQASIPAKKSVLIYPEGHVWPYYTGIRPLPLAAFHYPVKTPAPVFTLTTTYQDRGSGKKPRETVFVDGPLLVPTTGSRKERQTILRDAVAAQMERRSRANDIEYYRYLPREPEGDEAK
ncbi:1-acyl-sn-glycerol-3-phosphate acyltransferase [Lapidilactobacillus luobeiensis]|uniref:1-acyl-sn-glycerol-3-phosphate acyltransferase n=1 Tax=Lapidilactobacillus luobeiensis TaxID=2950371 RepID=UPI0021C26BCE|nr:1-acyl-sn-glycerol-3-phosphate acyltransferase [Lapidilactobacillus luobeiensis]